MRGKVTDQDLTDYALNELPPEERLYVESMLAVSEECRGDVYQMLEFGEMLKEGFEADEESAKLLLSDEQRSKLLEVPRWNWRGVLRNAAAIALLAAGTAYTVTRPAFWQKGGTAEQISNAGVAVKDLVAGVGQKDLARDLEEYNSRMRASTPSVTEGENEWQFVATPAICTPPTPPVAEM